MIGLDTNILARAILEDDVKQSPLAQKTIVGKTGYINHVVLCELLWLLAYSYGYNRGQLHNVLEKLIYSDGLVIEEHGLVEEAFALYQASKADFADILIGLRNRKAGCKTTFTFDKPAAKLDEFTLLA